MRKEIIMIIIITIMYFVPVTQSYALEDDTGLQYLASAKFDYSFLQSDEAVKDVVMPYSMQLNNRDADRYATVSKPDDNMIAKYTGLTYQQHPSHILSPNLPPGIVNDITHEFYPADQRSSSPKGFQMDMPSSISDIFIIGTAFLTNLVAHEFGHEVLAQHVGAAGTELNFFKKMNGQFFLGTSVVDNIADESVLPYTMGGEFFADLTFEHALRDYRKSPNMYNKALLLSSGLDFAWYCLYAFYMGNESPSYDPITISEETGISRNMLFSIVMAKTMINAYRVYAGHDAVIPYFTVDKNSAMLNIAFPFEIKGCIFKDCDTPSYTDEQS